MTRKDESLTAQVRTYERHYAVIKLSELNVAELDALEAFWKHAIETARPICEQRDKEARQKVDAGGHPDERLYRPVPNLDLSKGV